MSEQQVFGIVVRSVAFCIILYGVYCVAFGFMKTLGVKDGQTEAKNMPPFSYAVYGILLAAMGAAVILGADGIAELAFQR